MARHDLRCTLCGALHRDIDIPVTQGARAYCATAVCGAIPSAEASWWGLCRGTLEPVPALRLSLFSDGGHEGGQRDFQKFPLPVEDPGAPGGWRQETLGSLQDIRRIERESAQRERNGEGARLVWRDYSQDVSNRDQHTLGQDPSLRPAKTYLNGTPVRVRRGEAVVADHGVPAEFQEQA